MTEAGERWFGEYRLDREVGRGGMGRVWRAWHAPTERFVALKLLPAAAADDEEYRRRFEREARVAARLSDPHVVAIHSYGRVGDQLYIDMALIDGDDLAALLIDGGRIAPERAVYLLGQVASAVDAAHAAGLVHRDIKPGNVLVSRNDFAYLIDFGIARPRDGTALTTGSVAIGTIAYMAPERFDGVATARSDIYSLGCVLVECLTGRRAFPGDSHAEQINAHLNHAPPRPSTVVAGVPPALDRVIAKALAKKPEDRFATATEFALAAWAALEADEVPLSEPVVLPAVVSPSPGSAESGAERLVVRGVATPVLGAGDETESPARAAKSVASAEFEAAATPVLPDDSESVSEGRPADSAALTPALAAAEPAPEVAGDDDPAPEVAGEADPADAVAETPAAAEPVPSAAEVPADAVEPDAVAKLLAPTPADPVSRSADAGLPTPAAAVSSAADAGLPTPAAAVSSAADAELPTPAAADSEAFAGADGEAPTPAAADAEAPALAGDAAAPVLAVADGAPDPAAEKAAPSADDVEPPAGEPESDRPSAGEPTPVLPEPVPAPPIGRNRVILRDPIDVAPKPPIPKPLPVRAAAVVLGVLGTGVLTTTLLLAAPDGPSEEAGTAPTSIIGPAESSPGPQLPGVAAPSPHSAPTSGAPIAVEMPGTRPEPVLVPAPVGEAAIPAPPAGAVRPPLPSVPAGAPITSRPEPPPPPPTTVPPPTTLPPTTPQPTTTEPPTTPPTTTAPATTTATETTTQPSLPTQPAAAPIEPAPIPVAEPGGPTSGTAASGPVTEPGGPAPGTAASGPVTEPTTTSARVTGTPTLSSAPGHDSDVTTSTTEPTPLPAGTPL
ncbi:serine/threonine-protein kinase [Nocardia harenae]|uniref:serine/threonine-protein kinase n=1 Tax=Nocardia harenae TaxID=358707 RepID=UPI0008379CCC|nr:serine/threonine protein kinase [Nocardia harenae]